MQPECGQGSTSWLLQLRRYKYARDAARRKFCTAAVGPTSRKRRVRLRFRSKGPAEKQQTCKPNCVPSQKRRSVKLHGSRENRLASHLQYSGIGIGSEEELKREELGVTGAGMSPRAAEKDRLVTLRPRFAAELLPGFPRLFKVSFGKPCGLSLRSKRPRGDSGSF